MAETADLHFIARIAHEVNRAYCAAIGDNSHLPWESAPKWQRDSAIGGVLFHVKHPEAGPADSHEAWRAARLADGWTWGPQKDIAHKQHPGLVPFDHLPAAERVKDHLFAAVCRAYTGSIDVPTASAPAAVNAEPAPESERKDIEIGDVVYLRSGSPPMTAVYVEPTVVHASWFDEAGQCRRNGYPPACLCHDPAAGDEVRQAVKELQWLIEAHGAVPLPDLLGLVSQVDNLLAPAPEPAEPVNGAPPALRRGQVVKRHHVGGPCLVRWLDRFVNAEGETVNKVEWPYEPGDLRGTVEFVVDEKLEPVAPVPYHVVADAEVVQLSGDGDPRIYASVLKAKDYEHAEHLAAALNAGWIMTLSPAAARDESALNPGVANHDKLALAPQEQLKQVARDTERHRRTG